MGAYSLKLHAKPPKPAAAAVEPQGVNMLGRGRLETEVATEAVDIGGL